ncbi:hypothetical protein K503DRAFT_302411 [Rhizopogon vinicolor AM-OR11-026]|uniref:Uncharacterized protein n=1 Tax=Rhizopogon vinicolor AM-OR11-026 TaxID=1314800 RepID=A0A1B7NI84_9AGAM|nr:hypothetical protein K503DRAFT_302411 [Rhizopogon vinicolor AM-OR11-026]
MASQPLSPMSRARAVHDEATDSLRRIGHEFNQIIIDSVNESRVHRSRAIELEDRHRDLVTENNTFRIHNEELKRLLELSQPDAGSAIESSGSAYRKLRHVRRIMRDLLEDLTTEFGDSPNEGASLLLHSEPRERAQVRELGAPASPSSRSRRNDMSSNSPSSGNTVRPRSSGKLRHHILAHQRQE